MEFPKQNQPQQKAPGTRATHSAYGTTKAITPQEAHVPDDVHPINPTSSEANNACYHYLEQSVQYNVHRNPSSLEANISDYDRDIKPRFSEAGNGSYHHFEQAAQYNVQQNPNSSKGVNDVRYLENLYLQYQAMFAELNNGYQNSAGSLGVNGNKGYPPGFRFCPYDHELIEHYLKRKIENPLRSWDHIKEINLYDFDLKELKEEEGPEWYFFTPRDRKYPNGQRPNRATTTGYWKATGADRPIVLEDKINGEKKEKKIIGKKKPLVFFETKSQNSHENKKENKKTEWIMYEYQAHDPTASKQKKRKTDNDMRLDDFVLCKISKTGRSFKSLEHGDQATSMIGSSTFHDPSIPPTSGDNVQAFHDPSITPTSGDNVQACHDPSIPPTSGDNVQASSCDGLPSISGDNVQTMDVPGNFQTHIEPRVDSKLPVTEDSTWAQKYDIWNMAPNEDFAPYQDFAYNFHGMSYGFAPPIYNYAFIPHFPTNDNLSATTSSDQPRFPHFPTNDNSATTSSDQPRSHFPTNDNLSATMGSDQPRRFTDKDLTSSMDNLSPSKKDNPSD